MHMLRRTLPVQASSTSMQEDKTSTPYCRPISLPTHPTRGALITSSNLWTLYGPALLRQRTRILRLTAISRARVWTAMLRPTHREEQAVFCQHTKQQLTRRIAQHYIRPQPTQWTTAYPYPPCTPLVNNASRLPCLLAAPRPPRAAPQQRARAVIVAQHASQRRDAARPQLAAQTPVLRPRLQRPPVLHLQQPAAPPAREVRHRCEILLPQVPC